MTTTDTSPNVDRGSLGSALRAGFTRAVHFITEKKDFSPTAPNESTDITDHRTAERTRLNRRIHTITGTQTARNFAKYRKQICRQSSAFNRGAQSILIDFEGRRFVEPDDALNLMHQFLDDSGVPTLQ